MSYEAFLASKSDCDHKHGFKPVFLPDCLFDFQKSLAEWAIWKGRAALFEECGLGKSIQQLVWADNVVRHTNKPVLIMTPLAVSQQTVKEAEKFGIEATRSQDGKFRSNDKIIVTNYERLKNFDKSLFVGAVCDESGILKNFDGKTKDEITEFMRTLPYRLLATATPSPNDYIELGTSSECLGELGYIDMLKMFFKSSQNDYAQGGKGGGRWSQNPFGGKFRFRGHAEQNFWRWVCSWARAIRKPSDIGGDDSGFTLPALITRQHVVKATKTNPEWLIDVPATNLKEQREERRRTLQERCEKAAEIIAGEEGQSIAWCYLNDEGDLLEKMIPNSVQVSGDDSDDFKEKTIERFVAGEIETLISKPVIFGFGLNLQNCAHQTFFPQHSFEQFYQAVRRSHRFGQKNQVVVDVITSEGESKVLANLLRKSDAAERMFESLVSLMNNELKIEKKNTLTNKERMPKWL